MRPESTRDKPCRVLSLFPHPRQVGHVVLDEGGLVPSGWFACRTDRYPTLDARLVSLERLIQRSVTEYRPTIVVIVGADGSAAFDAMIAHAIPSAEQTGVPLRVCRDSALDDLFVDDDAREYDRLGQSITRVFFPELARGVPSWNRRGNALRRRRRSVWKAAAGALAVLAETRPRSILALARTSLPVGLASFIDRVSLPRL